jgi:hypothetical protein
MIRVLACLLLLTPLYGCHSTSRVNKRLLALTRAGLLKRFFIGSGGWKKSLYALSSSGAKLLGKPYRSVRIANDQLVTVSSTPEHQLGINDMYCLAKHKQIGNPARIESWKNVFRPIDPNGSLIPDAWMDISGPAGAITAFLEFDLGTENLVIWKKKVEKYLQYAISGEFEHLIHRRQFRVLVVANSDARQKALQQATLTITDKIFWFTTIEAIRHQGFWSEIWVRPHTNQPNTLL